MTKPTYNYLLTIDLVKPYETEKLKEKLDIAVDWLRVVPGVYFIYTTTNDVEIWYGRIKKALPNNRFFITKIDISQGDYQGWLPQKKWDWIKEHK